MTYFDFDAVVGVFDDHGEIATVVFILDDAARRAIRRHGTRAGACGA